MTTHLWSGRFDVPPDAAAFEWGSSFGFDRRLFEDDVIGSLAWGRALRRAGVLTADEAGTRALLGERGIEVREAELVSAALDDRPGSLGMAARRLADRGINVEALMPTGMSGSRITVAFAVDDAAAAREALGDLAAVGSQPV